LINDMLDLSKLEAGRLEAHCEVFDVHALVERVIASMQPTAGAKKLSLHFEVAPELREIVTDRRRVEQILLNLISDALKFTERGGVTLAVEATTVVSTSTPAVPGAVIRFTVTDTGRRLRPEDMRHLFKPFRQINAGQSRQNEGTGLGLVICQRLAALLGGGVTVESRWTEGSAFTLTIPLVKAVDG